MKTRFRDIFFIVMFSFSGILQAQTTNVGDLYISEGTIMSSVGAMDNKKTGNLLNDGNFYLYSHYNNDGLVTFSPNSKVGKTLMVGKSGFQNISGTTPFQLNNVEFNNEFIQPAFNLSNEISIAGISDFKYGIIDNDNFDGVFIFEKGASSKNVSDESFVDGKVQKNGDEAFIFPIGDQNWYRLAGVSAPNEKSSSFTSKYYYEDSGRLYNHNQKTEIIELINDKEYWTIENTSGNSDVMITLSWDETTTTPLEIVKSPENQIHIVRWDAVLNKWVDEGGIANTANKTITTEASVKGFGVFTTARVKSRCQFKIYNAISPGADKQNAEFLIEGLADCSSDNTVEIYNRWGVKVFETSNYGSNGNVFKGYSEGRATINKGELLPSGTYFYIINVNYKNAGNQNETFKEAGYLYLSN